MKIAMISEHASPVAAMGGVDAGGQNVHVAALASALVKFGHAVTVYTRRDATALPASMTLAPGVTVRHVDAGPPQPISKDAIYPFVPEFAAQLGQLWAADCPDIVHSHFWMSGLAALRAAEPLGLGVVHTFHALGSEKRRQQGDADTSPADRLTQERHIARSADRIVATASTETFELLRMGADSQAVRLIPCGVDLDRFAPNAQRGSSPAGHLRVGAIARLVPRKGIDTIVEALADVPNTEVIVAGSGSSPDARSDPEATRLRALAEGLGVAGRVRFEGQLGRNAVAELIRSVDVVACTPWYEPFGLVALEAMACAVPVVASNVGGLLDTVVPGFTGLHVAPRAAQEVAAALNLLRLDPAKRAAFGEAAFERAQARYSWNRIAAETLDVYRAVIHERAEMDLALES